MLNIFRYPLIKIKFWSFSRYTRTHHSTPNTIFLCQSMDISQQNLPKFPAIDQRNRRNLRLLLLTIPFQISTFSHVSYLYEFRKIRIDLSNSFFVRFLQFRFFLEDSPSSPRQVKRRYNVARGWKNERGGPNPEPQASNSYTNAILKWRHFITRRFENWSGNELPYLIPAQVAHGLTTRGTRYFFSPFPLFSR